MNRIDAWHDPDPGRVTVLFFSCNFVIGGMQRQVVDLVTHMNRDRFRPLVACFGPSGPFAEELEDVGIPFACWDIQPTYDLGSIRVIGRMVQLLRQERVHIFQTYEFPTKVLGWTAGRLARTPVITCAEHGTGEPKDQLAKTRLLRGMSRFCDRFIYVADAQRRFYRDQRGFRLEGRTKVIYNGINHRRFDPDAVKPVSADEFGIPVDVPIVGITAVLREEKAHDVLLRALPIIDRHVQGTHILIVGDGPERPKIEKLAVEMGIRDRVVITGFRQDVERLLPLFDVMALCSDPVAETCPLSVLEAMSMGKPIVATRVSGLPELVVEGETGHLVDIRDHAALGERIGRLLADPERARSYGRAGRRRLLDGFTIPHMVANHEEYYTQILRDVAGLEIA
jgi:glycosyltransferase involved in cell wall biosynthesis